MRAGFDARFDVFRGDAEQVDAVGRQVVLGEEVETGTADFAAEAFERHLVKWPIGAGGSLNRDAHLDFLKIRRERAEGVFPFPDLKQELIMFPSSGTPGSRGVIRSDDRPELVVPEARREEVARAV